MRRRLENTIKNMEFEFKKFSPLYLPSLAKLLDDSFKISIRQKDKLIEWKLLNPLHKNKVITYVALNLKHKVISHYTNLPITIKSISKLFKALVCIDMATDKKYRGQKLISKLSELVYADVKKDKYDFSIGFSNDDGVKVDKNAKNYGYKLVGKFVRYFKVVITKKDVPLKLVSIKDFSVITKENGMDLFCLKKDYSFLNWRYVQKPSKEYELYKIIDQDKKDLGFVVLRFIRQKCYVYDIILREFSRETLLTVLRSIENKSLEKQVRIVVYNVLDNNFWKDIFNRYKYFKRTNNKVNYYLTIKFHQTITEEDALLNKEQWFLMNGDII